MSRRKFCACRCGTKLTGRKADRHNQGKRRGYRFAPGHSTETARVWRSPDSRGDLRKKKGGRAAAPSLHAEQLSSFVPEPGAWYRAEYVAVIGNFGFIYKLNNGDRIFVHKKLMPEDAGQTIVARLERNPRGSARWLAQEVLAAEETQQ